MKKLLVFLCCMFIATSFSVKSAFAISLTFSGEINSLREYEYHASTGTYLTDNTVSVSIPLNFTIITQFTVNEIASSPSDFLFFDELTSSYSDSQSQLYQMVQYYTGSETSDLNYREVYTLVDQETFYAHSLILGGGTGHGGTFANDRYDLLDNYLNMQDMFSFTERAYTVANWDPANSSPNAIRIGEEAKGLFSLTAYDPSISPGHGTNPVPEPATILLMGIGLVGLAGFRRKFKK